MTTTEPIEPDRPHASAPYRQPGMRSTPWQPLERELGVRRAVSNVHYPEFSLVIKLVRPWLTGTPTAWESHITEVTTGLELSHTGFVHRRDAELWSWYRAVACWPLLVQYRDLLHEQFKANLAHDGRQADQRHLITARIEKVALRDAKRDRDDATAWASLDADLDPEVDPDLRFVPAPDEALAELEENPALLPDDGPAPA